MKDTSSDSPIKARRKPGRVPSSCAECRRLKLRCDRKVPCEQCVKRRCASICPGGSLAPGRGNRMVLSTTEELHDKIEILTARIRELEDALKTLQATVSDEAHPLLKSDSTSGVHERLPLVVQYVVPPSNPSAETEPWKPESWRREEEHLLDAFGTLTLGSKGEASFLGKTARSEYLIDVLRKPPPLAKFPSRLSSKILDAPYCDEEPPSDATLHQEIVDSLPPLSEAIHLCELYLKHGQYAFTNIPRDQLLDGLLSGVYRAQTYTSPQCYHSLALLYVIFALGALFDPARLPSNMDARDFFYLCRSAMSFCSPVRYTTLEAVQVLMHMSQYLELSETEAQASSTAWVYIGHAVRLAHSIGLHLNSARWHLDEGASQYRSRVFWPLFCLDAWSSFGFGRPPSMSISYVDCAFPKDPDEVLGEGGQPEMGFHMWCWQYTTLMHTVMSTAFGAKIPPYPTIFELDYKIRNFPVPQRLRPICDDIEAPESIIDMQRSMVMSYKESTLLNLHRCYFAQVLHDQPDDLMKHKYTASLMVTYRSAWRLLEGLGLYWRKVPLMLARLNLPWSQALSAAIVMCLLVTRAPSSPLTASALAELDRAALVFEQAAPTCPTASSLLVSVLCLRRKAHDANSHTESQEEPAITPAELDRLGGKTHLISERSAESPESTSTSSSGSSPAGQSPGMDIFGWNGTELTENMHPTILGDMKAFDVSAPVNDQSLFDFPDMSMTDMQFLNSDLFPMFNAQPQPINNPQYGYQLPTADTVTGPPVLDATWQSFVEQLGF